MKRNILLLFTFFACITVQGQTPVRLVDLRSEHLDRPIGLDNPVPRLSWRMEDGRQGAVQTSWRIVVDEDSLNVVNGCGRMWDSGKNDSRNQLVAYAGKKLQPFTRYYWKVICSDMKYKETASPVSYFETGMMGMQHWQGAWIGDGKDIHYGPAPYFRKEFKTGKKVKSARAYIAAAGLYELYINGEKIGDHCLAPLYTRFDRRNLYVAYDVTSQLQNGDNAIGVLLGNGWYNHQSKAVWVFDKDGKFLAVFYTDFHPRAGKRSGAWMTSYKEQWIDEKTGENSRPHISIVMNFTKPTQDKPALLTFGEVETFLHEFGHSLHGMFANTTYGSLSGTNVYWDFVELPSQFMENFAIEKEFLHTFARHYQTGELIPGELVQRIVDSSNFNAAYACLRQVSFGLLDMAWYTRNTPFEGDVKAYEKKAWEKAQILPSVAEACMSTQFSHIFAGGYSAGYYSYKWAEVLDADAFSLFKQTGIFNPETAASFRENILSKGGTEHPMTLYKRFRGQEPTIDALLIRNGIKK